ncbi:MAG: hypothetical protein ACKVVT_16040 [Dehalococcoidia bacterium]
MGATAWHYFTRYERDPATALAQLRQEVFARGEFRTGNALEAAHAQRFVHALKSGSDKSLESQERELLGTFRASVDSAPWYLRSFVRRALVKDILSGAVDTGSAANMDGAVRLAGASGTHSILDIANLGARRGTRVASPVSDHALEHYFGTVRPCRSDVDERAAEICADLDRWEAVYFAVWGEGEDGEPREWAFVGVSGE